MEPSPNGLILDKVWLGPSQSTNTPHHCLQPIALDRVGERIIKERSGAGPACGLGRSSCRRSVASHRQPDAVSRRLIAFNTDKKCEFRLNRCRLLVFGGAIGAISTAARFRALELQKYDTYIWYLFSIALPRTLLAPQKGGNDVCRAKA